MTEEPKRACLNCGEPLLGDYCHRCGQEAVEARPSFRQLAGELVGDVLNLDTKLLRTLGPLLFRPGALTRDHLEGRRVRYVTPLKTYLIAALIFFGLVALVPRARVTVITKGEEKRVSAPGRGVNVAFELPQRYVIFDAALQKASAQAKAHPQEFGRAVFDNLPRAFFLLLPVFALLLKLFYWPQDRYYLDHLVFSLHYHAFVFLALAVWFVAGRSWVPEGLTQILAVIVLLGLLTYLPRALRRVYGGSWPATLLKLMGLAVSYGIAFAAVVALLVLATLSTFEAS